MLPSSLFSGTVIERTIKAVRPSAIARATMPPMIANSTTRSASRRRRIAPGQRLLLDPGHDRVDLVIDIEDAASRLRQQRVALGTLSSPEKASPARRARSVRVSTSRPMAATPSGMDGGDRLQILIETRLGLGGILLELASLG
jgi:hypothetical protein